MKREIMKNREITGTRNFVLWLAVRRWTVAGTQSLIRNVSAFSRMFLFSKKKEVIR